MELKNMKREEIGEKLMSFYREEVRKNFFSQNRMYFFNDIDEQDLTAGLSIAKVVDKIKPGKNKSKKTGIAKKLITLKDAQGYFVRTLKRHCLKVNEYNHRVRGIPLEKMASLDEPLNNNFNETWMDLIEDRKDNSREKAQKVFESFKEDVLFKLIKEDEEKFKKIGVRNYICPYLAIFNFNTYGDRSDLDELRSKQKLSDHEQKTLTKWLNTLLKDYVTSNYDFSEVS